MDFIMSFLQERWYIIIAVIILLFIVVRIVKTVIKWVIVLALLAGLYYYGASYKDQLINIGSAVTTEAKNQAIKMVSTEMNDAQYKMNGDQTFTVTTKSVRLDGKLGSNEVKITFMNQTFTVPMSDVLNAVIEQAKKNSKV